MTAPSDDHEKRISLLEQAILALQSTNEGISTKLDLILGQITKIALLEQKHDAQKADITRLELRINKIEADHEAFSRETRSVISEFKGMWKLSGILWACLGGTTITLLIKVMFFMAQQGVTP